MGSGEERFRIQRPPELQTLRVLSSEPETIVFPSGEKATELIRLLWAFVFSLTKVRDAASVGRKALVSLSKGRGSILKRLTPDFEGLVVTAGNDRLSIWRIGHGSDRVAVGVALLRHELQCGCEGQGESASKGTSGFGLNARLNSRL